METKVEAWTCRDCGLAFQGSEAGRGHLLEKYLDPPHTRSRLRPVPACPRCGNIELDALTNVEPEPKVTATEPATVFGPFAGAPEPEPKPEKRSWGRGPKK